MDNLQSIALNNFQYKGTVSITLDVLGHKSKQYFFNAGTKHLFDTITKALAGYSIAECTPRFLDVQHQITSTEYASVLRTTIPFTGIVYGDAAEASDNDGVLLLNATITAEDKQPLRALHNPRIVMTDAFKRELAIIDEASIQAIWDSINQSTDAIVEWRLQFSNKEIG